jgi:hypothetical protein
MTAFQTELHALAEQLDLPQPMRAVAGFVVFTVAALLWMGLRFMYRRKVAAHA